MSSSIREGVRTARVHSSPYCLMGSRRPQQPRAGFVFPASEDVVLKLRPDGQPESVFEDRDLVLHERAVNVVVLVMRQKVEGGDSLDEIAGTPSSAQSPDNFISLLEDEMVNQVNVKRVASFSQLRSKTVSPVIISLDLEVRSITEFTTPAPQEIAARYVLRSVYGELPRVASSSRCPPAARRSPYKDRPEPSACRDRSTLRIRSEPRLS